MSVRPSSASDDPVGLSTRFQERLSRGPSVESMLWIIAVTAMLLDVWLTDYGLAMGLSEANPLGRAALAAFGSTGLLLAKLAVLALAVVGWWVLPDAERWAVPLGLALPWGLATITNISVLL